MGCAVGSAAGRAGGSGELVAVRAAFPGWRVWRSSVTGRVWAVGAGRGPRGGWVCADSPAELSAVLEARLPRRRPVEKVRPVAEVAMPVGDELGERIIAGLARLGCAA